MTFATRLRQTCELMALEMRAMNIAPLVAGSAAGLLIVGLGGKRAHAPPEQTVATLVVAGLVIALGAAFIFDDPATESIGSTPTSLLFRRCVRVTMTGVPVGLAWMSMLAFVRVRASPDVPLGLPSLAFVAMLAFALAAAASGGRAVADGAGGLIAGPALLIVVGLSRALPPRFRFFEARSGMGYSVPVRLFVVIAVCVLALIWSSLDPGRVNRLRAIKLQR